jgi:acetolactate synthase-1/2/3 large subunit
MALAELEGVDLMVFAGTTQPVAFFAYPNRPSVLVPDGCATLTLAERSEDAVAGLAALADELGAPSHGPSQALALPEAAPSGKQTAYTIGASIARHMPEGAIVCDDAVTSGAGVAAAAMTARPHEVLALTGGAIGSGLPLAIGAAVAAPDRKVLSLNGDGAAMYTVQSLWTMARERLDITTVILSNRKYQILLGELANVGANPGRTALEMMDLGNPDLNWAKMAEGMGVEAARADTADAFADLFSASLKRKGPVLIELIV